MLFWILWLKRGISEQHLSTMFMQEACFWRFGTPAPKKCIKCNFLCFFLPLLHFWVAFLRVHLFALTNECNICKAPESIILKVLVCLCSIWERQLAPTLRRLACDSGLQNSCPPLPHSVLLPPADDVDPRAYLCWLPLRVIDKDFSPPPGQKPRGNVNLGGISWVGLTCGAPHWNPTPKNTLFLHCY